MREGSVTRSSAANDNLDVCLCVDAVKKAEGQLRSKVVNAWIHPRFVSMPDSKVETCDRCLDLAL